MLHILCLTQFVSFFTGAEQAPDPEGLGACHAAPPPRVHAGAGVPPAQQHPEDEGRAHTSAAPDGAYKPAGVQQEEGAGAQTQTRHGGPAATQESESKESSSE